MLLAPKGTMQPAGPALATCTAWPVLLVRATEQEIDCLLVTSLLLQQKVVLAVAMADKTLKMSHDESTWIQLAKCRTEATVDKMEPLAWEVKTSDNPQNSAQECAGVVQKSDMQLPGSFFARKVRGLSFFAKMLQAQGPPFSQCSTERKEKTEEPKGCFGSSWSVRQCREACKHDHGQQKRSCFYAGTCQDLCMHVYTHESTSMKIWTSWTNDPALGAPTIGIHWGPLSPAAWHRRSIVPICSQWETCGTTRDWLYQRNLGIMDHHDPHAGGTTCTAEPVGCFR